MKVTLIAKTVFEAWPESVRKTKFGITRESMKDAWHMEDLPNDMDTLAEFAGRACYQSWNMPNPATESPEDYLANIISSGHFSVLEHSSATFYIEGVSRNLTHELIRHRHLSYSELSQRFVDMSNANLITPPAVLAQGKVPEAISIQNYPEARRYGDVVHHLMNEGKTRKEAREAARFYLPSGMETKIVVTGNMRAWRDMLHKRYSVHADAEIRELAKELLKELRYIAPASFQDFPEEPFE